MSEPFEEDVGLPSERAQAQAEEHAARTRAIASFAERRPSGEPLSDVAIASRCGRSLTWVRKVREEVRLAELAKLATPEGPIVLTDPEPEVTPEPQAEGGADLFDDEESEEAHHTEPVQVETPPEVTPAKPKRVRKSRAKKAEPVAEEPQREGRITHLTREEYLREYQIPTQDGRDYALQEHEATVLLAVRAGKEVPAHVLAEYPDLLPEVVHHEPLPAQTEAVPVDDAAGHAVEDATVRKAVERHKVEARDFLLWTLAGWESAAIREEGMSALVEIVRSARLYTERKFLGIDEEELHLLDAKARTRGLMLRLWGWIEDARDHAPLYSLASYVRGLLAMEEELISEAEGK